MKLKTIFKVFMFVILFYFARNSEIYLMILTFGVVHEIGHLLVKMILEKTVRNKELKKIIIAMAGPITNLLIILISQKIELDIFTEAMVIISNLLIIIYNLIPIYPLDGGKILKIILQIFLNKEKANTYINKISFVFIIITTIVASIGILYLKDISIFLAISYIWYAYLTENKDKKTNSNYKIIENY